VDTTLIWDEVWMRLSRRCDVSGRFPPVIWRSPLLPSGKERPDDHPLPCPVAGSVA